MLPDFFDSVSHETRQRLSLYGELLAKWQKTINLVSPATLPDMGVRHFLDSAQLAPYLPTGPYTHYDIGSGAGFPGLVLAILRPDAAVTLIESDERKCAFLKTVSRETGVPVTVIRGRVESTDLPPPDLVSARALAQLSELLALTRPWWSRAPNLTLLFPKGAQAEHEVARGLESFNFSVQNYPSKTDPAGQILVLTGVTDRCA